MQPPPRTSYDEVPYVSHPYAQTHPSRLAAIASLFGMTPAPVHGCRVLEIGCASGENLLPIALQFPQCEFVGVDLSAAQIAAAQTTVDELSMENVRLLHADLRSLSPDIGMFDYILAHGVYSWISNEAQKALLDACHSHLAPQGVAYVSYNTYPGWHLRGMIRDMMNYRVRLLRTNEERIQQARALLRFLADSVDEENSAYGILLNQELRTLSQQDDSYLFHEHLEEFNQPVYFHEFAERAAAAGLQYLGEAAFSTMFVEVFPQLVQTTLRSVASTLIEAEQYMDFVRNRTFRQTLLCRREVILDRSLAAERITSMSIASPTRSESGDIDLRNNSEMKFRSGASIATTSDPLTKAALLCLGDAWPRYVNFRELFDAARKRLGSEFDTSGAATAGEKSAQLAQSLLGCYANGHIDLLVAPPRFEMEVKEKPVASMLARYQATKQLVATNQLHVDIQLQEHERHLLCKLDGQHNTSSLVDHLVNLIKDGTLRITNERGPFEHPQEIQQAARLATTAALNRFAECGLLV